MPTVTTLTKTQSGVALAHTQQTTANVTVGSDITVTAAMAAKFLIKLGRAVATALGNEVLFRIEASAKPSGTDEWFPVYQFTSTSGKTVANSTTLNGATTAGNTTCVLTSATGILAGDILYFRETGTPTNSEWSRVKSASGTTITFEEAQTRNHTNGIAVTDSGEIFAPIDIDCSTVGRLRLVVDSAANASGQTVDVIGWVVTLDSATNT